MALNGWKEEKLENLCSMKYGKMPKKDDLVGGIYPVFSGYGIVGKHKSYLYENPEVVLIARGVGGTGDVKMSPPKCYVTNISIVLSILDNTTLDKRFLYWKLKQENLRKLDSGAAQSQITITDLNIYSIKIPKSIETQRKIAGILSAYDDLIENNNKRIKILEEMAQKLYKEWFVDFKFPNHETTKFVESELGLIPEGWAVVKLGSKINIRKGKNITKETITEGKVPVVAGGLNPAYYHNKANAKAPVITISASGANAGYINLYYQDIWASDCSYINPDATPFVYFYYLLFKNKNQEVTGLQRGSAQPHVYPKDLMELPTYNIPDSLISTFEEKISVAFNLINNLSNKNDNLRTTRDLLLPRLISGELSVENLDNLEAAA